MVEVDGALDSAALNLVERMALKNGLSRAGMLSASAGTVATSADQKPLPRPVLHALAAAGVELGTDGRISLDRLDAGMAGAAMADRFTVKQALGAAGRLTR